MPNGLLSLLLQVLYNKASLHDVSRDRVFVIAHSNGHEAFTIEAFEFVSKELDALNHKE